MENLERKLSETKEKLRSQISAFVDTKEHYDGIISDLKEQNKLYREKTKDKDVSKKVKAKYFSEIDLKMSSLNNEKQRILKEKIGLIDNYKKELECLTSELSQKRLNETMPIVGKKIHSSLGRATYSLWFGNEPVFMYYGEKCKYLAAARQDEAMSTSSVKTEKAFFFDRQKLEDIAKNAQSGDFVTPSGYILEGKQKDYAREIFEKVKEGIKMLPRSDSPEGYKIKSDENKTENKTANEIKYRHWGQSHLASLNPEKVVQGNLLGSGGSYKAFAFGDKTVVEFDQTERATYLFDTNYFDSLRPTNRQKILSQKPEGFEGRVIHHDSQENWISKIKEYLVR